MLIARTARAALTKRSPVRIWLYYFEKYSNRGQLSPISSNRVEPKTSGFAPQPDPQLFFYMNPGQGVSVNDPPVSLVSLLSFMASPTTSR